MKKNCRFCSKEYEVKGYQQVYCDKKCRNEFHKQKQIVKVANSGPLNKKVKCTECSNTFVRSHSTIKTCSDECKKDRKHKQKRRKCEKHKRSFKYLTARKAHISCCKICNKKFKSRLPNQKCCGKDCRVIYSKIDHNIRAKEARVNIDIKIAENLRSRISRSIKRNQKGGSAVKDLGCSIEELKTHLENLFQEGMTWENYGLKGWHIDHIKPLALFNLTNSKEFKEAAHYTNLQPLWAKDNLSKGAKYEYNKH